jgi:hypothetical protein
MYATGARAGIGGGAGGRSAALAAKDVDTITLAARAVRKIAFIIYLPEA